MLKGQALGDALGMHSDRDERLGEGKMMGYYISVLESSA